MTDRSMDSFDARLTELLTTYSDRAVATYDAAAIAREATARDGSLRLRLGLPLHLGRGVRLLLLAAAVALLALAASLMAGGSRPQPTPRGTIVLGPDGPEQTVYRVSAGPNVGLTFENRSDVTWVPWGGFAEKFDWCHLVSGPVAANPCAVAPGATVVQRPPYVEVGPMVIYLAPLGVDFHSGIPVTIVGEAEPWPR